LGKDLRERGQKERMNLEKFELKLKIGWVLMAGLGRTESWQKGRMKRRWMSEKEETWLNWM